MLKRYSYQRLDKIQEAVDSLLPDTKPAKRPARRPAQSDEITAQALLRALAKLVGGIASRPAEALAVVREPLLLKAQGED